MRLQYRRGGLTKADVAPCPLEQFTKWFEESQQFELPSWCEPNAMSLSTSDGQGRVTSRTVLLKGCNVDGLVFYTNYESEKGQQLAANPQAALLFYWPHLERQVRVEGRVSQLERAASETYFHSRPRGSQIGAAASAQSQPIADRSQLESAFDTYESNLNEGPVPLPDHWGGYRLEPRRFEFWQGRENRLHDRICYRRTNEWTIERLQP
jgi:pyridoxamine 5'-phosphate oxidase